MTEYIVRVPVATIWTDPGKPRQKDEKAISYPADLEGWLGGMSTEERKQLTGDNIVQTQVLYGHTVTLLEEKGDWLHVIVNGQPSSKNDSGYPGWLPKAQVVKKTAEADENVLDGSFAVVVSPTAWLYDRDEPFLKVSYQTRLPVAGGADYKGSVFVSTPHGKRRFEKDDVVVYESESQIPAPAGADLVKSGEPFLELPYLWGGMSGFGFDCSGFTYTVHRAWGIEIPRDASDQEKEGKPVERQNLESGDLIYFAKDGGTGHVYHVGMYYGDGKMIHAPSAGKGIEIVPISETKYEENYCSAKRFW